MPNKIQPTDWENFYLYFPECFSITPERKGSKPRSKEEFVGKVENWRRQDVFSFMDGERGIAIYLNTRTPVELLEGETYQEHVLPKVINPIREEVLHQLSSVDGEVQRIHELFKKGFKPFQGFSPLEIKKDPHYSEDTVDFLSSGHYTTFDFFIGMVSGDYIAKNRSKMPREDMRFFDELKKKDLVLPYNSYEPAGWAAPHYAKADTIQQSLRNLIFLCEQHPRFEKAGLFNFEEETKTEEKD